MNTSIRVQNLKCGGCAATIVKKISKVENITDVVVDKDSSTVSFHYKDVASVDNVRSRLKSLGYPSIEEENTVKSKAISFVSCATGKISK